MRFLIIKTKQQKTNKMETQEIASKIVNTAPLTYSATVSNELRGILTLPWIHLNKEVPQYNKPILADNGEYMAVVARVSDGDNEYYPIQGTDVIMTPKPIKWYPIDFK